MAQQDQLTIRVDAAANSIGAALGRVAAELDKWKKQRAEITAEVQQLLNHSRRLLADLGHAPRTRARKGGRPKGYKTSAATRAKLRAAWARRKAAAADTDAARSSPA